MSWKDEFQDWLEFSARERRGILLLSVLIVLMIVYNYAAPHLFKSEAVDFTDRKAEIEKWMAEQTDSTSNHTDYTSFTIQKDSKAKRPLFAFNPNTATDETWKALGFSDGQIRSLRKFVDKGGSFKVKSDLSKMYVISQEEYEALYPYIELPEALAKSDKEPWENKNDYNSSYSPESASSYQKIDYGTLKIELNSADTTSLKKLKGIGGFIAKKIIESREKFGGFYSVDQLETVYRMTPEKVDSIRDNIVVDINLIRKMNVNTATFDQLNNHPIIDRSQAKTLIAYRDMHGPFKTIEGIKKCVLIDDATYEKIKYYLTVE